MATKSPLEPPASAVAAAGLYRLAEQHRQAGEIEAAIARYRELLHAVPRHLAALGALETLLDNQGEKDAARAICHRRKALEARDAYAIGKALAREDQHARALPFFERAISLKPDYRKAHWRLGKTLNRLKRLDAALGCYQRCVELDPQDVDANYMVAALGGEDPPACAPQAYVRSYFDNYAESFDEHLCKDLDYQGPEILFAYARRAMDVCGPCLDILDIGCGTGLAGKKFQGLARSLTGVDLSPEMIAQAKALGLYDHLHIAEAVAFLATAPAGRFDLLIACDSLVYIGDLAPLLQAAARALRDRGLFVFSLEKGDAPGFALQASGRFTHHGDYLAALVEDRFCIREAGEAVMRREYGAPVVEWVYVLEKRAVKS